MQNAALLLAPVGIASFHVLVGDSLLSAKAMLYPHALMHVKIVYLSILGLTRG
jgi:hypothetical protein